MRIGAGRPSARARHSARAPYCTLGASEARYCIGIKPVEFVSLTPEYYIARNRCNVKSEVR